MGCRVAAVRQLAGQGASTGHTSASTTTATTTATTTTTTTIVTATRVSGTCCSPYWQRLTSAAIANILPPSPMRRCAVRPNVGALWQAYRPVTHLSHTALPSGRHALAVLALSICAPCPLA